MAPEHLTVRQLINRIQTYPDDLPVVVQSYEEGFDPVTQIETITVRQRTNREWYVGVYEQSDASGETVLLVSSKYNRSDNEGRE